MVLHQTVNQRIIVGIALVEGSHFYSKPNTMFMCNAWTAGSESAPNHLSVTYSVSFTAPVIEEAGWGALAGVKQSEDINWCKLRDKHSQVY